MTNEPTLPTNVGSNDGLGLVPERDFVRRTNVEYAAWCQTYYQPEALDERGMQSLHGLWAWQEQERRIAAAVAAERERCATICEGMKTKPPCDDPEDVERGYNAALRRAAECIRGA